MTSGVRLAFGAAAALAIAGVVVAARTPVEHAPCGPGFTRVGPRCCPSGAASPDGRCASGGACPAPLVATAHGCDRPERDVVLVPATTVLVGPSDWEAEGRVEPRLVHVPAFALDRLEVTMGRLCEHAPRPRACEAAVAGDPARAAGDVSFTEARAFCAQIGGRLPTEDEWLAAAGGERPRRYPWGDTGAVCRRAAWGLASGPCADGATGPDTVGAHPEGATPLGVHDLAGNVAEWVDAPCAKGKDACPRLARGGSFRSRLATELRTWLREEVASEIAGRGDPAIGFRCAYDAPVRDADAH